MGATPQHTPFIYVRIIPNLTQNKKKPPKQNVVLNMDNIRSNCTRKVITLETIVLYKHTFKGKVLSIKSKMSQKQDDSISTKK